MLTSREGYIPSNYVDRVEYLTEQLHRAAHQGQLDELKRLIEKEKLDAMKKDGTGNTILHCAADNGHLNVLKYGIQERGLDPACRGWSKQTPLHRAAIKRHLELVKYLVQLGEQQVGPPYWDEYGYTPLHRACVNGDIDIIQYLINEMKKHTSLDSVIYDRTKAGNTAVHIAALSGHLPVIKLFISKWNFNLNIPGQDGASPLHSAAYGGYLDIVKYLVEEKHCDPLCRDDYRNTPIHWAAGQGRLNVIKYFEAHNYRMSITNKKFKTPLDLALANNHSDVVQYLRATLNF